MPAKRAAPDSPHARMIAADMADLQRTNKREQDAIGSYLDSEIDNAGDKAFSEVFRDGAGGKGMTLRKSFSFSLPWQKTVINGQVVDDGDSGRVG